MFTYAVPAARPSLPRSQPSLVGAANGRPITRLTPREQSVAALMARGLTTRTIAAELGISFFTARRHTERIFAKMGARSRVEVAVRISGGQPC